MIAIVDTHVFVWWVEGSPRLSVRARGVISDSANRLLWSAASTWELAIKASVRKEQFRMPVRDFLAKYLTELGFERLPVEDRHAWHVETLPFHHKDPFDRLLVAQAQVEGIPIVSRDARLSQYGIERIW